MLFYQKGNNSKKGDNWDKKKIQVTYFFMSQNIKFQNINIHGSKLKNKSGNLHIILNQHIIFQDPSLSTFRDILLTLGQNAQNRKGP